MHSAARYGHLDLLHFAIVKELLQTGYNSNHLSTWQMVLQQVLTIVAVNYDMCVLSVNGDFDGNGIGALEKDTMSFLDFK